MRWSAAAQSSRANWPGCRSRGSLYLLREPETHLTNATIREVRHQVAHAVCPLADLRCSGVPSDLPTAVARGAGVPGARRSADHCGAGEPAGCDRLAAAGGAGERIGVTSLAPR